ncbi:MAG: LemA family protein [Cytophagaceae bacterium]|nr:LemA family protein [Cytophagaceae bacterium]
MRRLLINLCIVLGLAGFSSCGYNDMVNMEEAVAGQWSQVENVYQRRADLIPNLVKTVQASANYEKSTLEAVINARAQATSIKIDANNLTEENIAKFQAAQDQLSSSLSAFIRLLAVSEAYPQLQANSNFRDLMAELSGTENRITVERKRFNEAVQEYNAYIRRFPNNMTASMFGFEKKGYFTARPGSDTPPPVDMKF